MKLFIRLRIESSIIGFELEKYTGIAIHIGYKKKAIVFTFLSIKGRIIKPNINIS